MAYRSIANLDALRAPNTNPANFVLHEVTNISEKLFQRFGIRSNDSVCPFGKIVIRSKGSGYLLEENSHSFERFNYPFKKIVSRAAVPNHFHPSRFSTNLSKM